MRNCFVRPPPSPPLFSLGKNPFPSAGEIPEWDKSQLKLTSLFHKYIYSSNDNAGCRVTFCPCEGQKVIRLI